MVVVLADCIVRGGVGDDDEEGRRRHWFPRLIFCEGSRDVTRDFGEPAEVKQSVVKTTIKLGRSVSGGPKSFHSFSVDAR